MAINLNWFSQDGEVGQGLMATYTIYSSAAPQTLPDIPGPPANLGDVAIGNSRSRWVFVQASTTVTSGNIIDINVSTWKANNLTNAIAVSAQGAGAQGDHLFGLAQFGGGTILSSLTQLVANTNDYFWAMLEGGNAALNINSTAQTHSVLYISSTVPGSVESTATTTPLLNLWVAASFAGTGSQTVTEGYFTGLIRVSTT